MTSDTSRHLLRIAGATVCTPDLDRAQREYAEWLGYDTVESGRIEAALADAWHAPAMAGRRFAVLQPRSRADVFIRLVEADPVPGFRPMTCFGWNAIEIIVDDVFALHRRLLESPFAVIGEPQPLTGFPSIIAMQVHGFSGEILYLTMESGDRSASLLPLPGAPVGRIFIAVIAGPDLDDLRDRYATRFALDPRPTSFSPIAILQQAQHLPDDHAFPLTILMLRDHGNLIELDGYDAAALPDGGIRPRLPGQLPPGIALFSFHADDLDARAGGEPIGRFAGQFYAGGRSVTLLGPTDELIELIGA